MTSSKKGNTFLKLIFTLDYEIHGNGDGSPMKLMVEPTYRLMNLLEKHNAKVLIFADIAEILCFKSYFEETGVDKFNYKDIVIQLQSAILRGHDVQLHIHSSYFKSKYTGVRWEQNWDEYNMAALPLSRIFEMVKTSKSFLENLLIQVNPTYRCTVFRAANWSMMPTLNIYKALVDNGIRIDSSVYKWGRQFGNVNYDYTNAYSNLLPYKASPQDINKKDEKGLLKEYPIYTELQPFWYFISWIRLFRMIRAKFHKHNTNKPASQSKKNDNNQLIVASFFKKSPWKLDFNQATSTQMIGALKRILKENSGHNGIIEVVSIGHSKTFIKYNERSLSRFLAFASKQNELSFGKFSTDI